MLLMIRDFVLFWSFLILHHFMGGAKERARGSLAPLLSCPRKKFAGALWALQHAKVWIIKRHSCKKHRYL